MNTKDEQYHALEGRKIDLGFVYLRARPTGRDLQWTCVGYDVSWPRWPKGVRLPKKPK